MDWESGKRQITEYITKYRYLILVLLAGVMLMLIPEQTKTPELIPVKEENQQNLQIQLEEILGEIAGVGKVRVLLTEASGWDTVYQVDESRSRENLDTVIISNSQREETGLVKQIIPPKYRGAVVVCRGADHAGVRLAVVDAVKRVTGLSSDCITVLKMK
jgi:stage III sporulation protein AG